MLTVDRIHGVNDWLAVLAWTLLVMGMTKAVFGSKASEWFIQWLGKWNYEYRYSQSQWQLWKGVVRTKIGEDAKKQPIFQDDPLTDEQRTELAAFVRDKWLVVWATRLVRVPFMCEFCGLAWVSLAMLSLFGEGERWLVSALMYSTLATFIGAYVSPRPAGKPQGSSCSGKSQQVTITPSMLPEKK